MSIKTMEGWKGGISELKGKQHEIAGLRSRILTEEV